MMVKLLLTQWVMSRPPPSKGSGTGYFTLGESPEGEGLGPEV